VSKRHWRATAEASKKSRVRERRREAIRQLPGFGRRSYVGDMLEEYSCLRGVGEKRSRTAGFCMRLRISPVEAGTSCFRRQRGPRSTFSNRHPASVGATLSSASVLVVDNERI
jgi:hypothetical protein